MASAKPHPDAVLMGRDNYGNTWGPLDPKRPRASLLEQMARKTAKPMYNDTTKGVRHSGYVVSAERGSHEVQHWVSLSWVVRSPWFGPSSSPERS